MTRTNKIACAVSLAAVFASGTSAAVRASYFGGHKMYLTFSGTVSLPGAELRAGTYIFETPDPDAPTLVRVTSRDHRKLYLMAFTLPVSRPQGMDPNRPIAFGESEPGTPPRVRAWYPEGDSTGREFIYKK